MPGPKPNLTFVLADLDKIRSRLRSLCKTTIQHQAVHELDDVASTIKMSFNYAPPDTQQSIPQPSQPSQPMPKPGPDVTDAYYAGQKARFDGKLLTDNPFEASNLHNAWNDGWESVNVEPKLS